jgi:hypothetical protein
MTAPIKSPGALILRWGLVILLAVAFGYIEAAVVVYLRQIFHPAGFNFPLAAFLLADDSRNLLWVEVGREAATLVLIFAAAILSGTNHPQRLAYFMTIFAVWDIFYYVWLKVILDWPASIMDWDILFLIPLPWAGPVLAPVLVSLTMLVFAAMILYRDCLGKQIKTSVWDWLRFSLAGLFVLASFCIAGRYITQPDYASHFSWLLLLAGLLAAITRFAKCLHRPNDAL